MVTCNPAPLVIDIMASRDLSAPAVFLLAFAGYPLSFCTTLKRLTHTWITNEPSTLRLEIGVRFSVTAYYSLDKEHSKTSVSLSLTLAPVTLVPGSQSSNPVFFVLAAKVYPARTQRQT